MSQAECRGILSEGDILCFVFLPVFLLERREVDDIVISTLHRLECIPVFRECRLRICFHADIHKNWGLTLIQDDGTDIIVVMAFRIAAAFDCECDIIFPVYCKVST